ncbi:MAG: ABC transporter permease, partial [Acidobacteriota bacterium]
RGSRSLSVIGRLAAGVSLPAAQADLDAISATLAAEYPDSNADRSTGVVPLKEIVVGEGGNLLLILFGATGLVLLIAAVNLVNLFYSRTFDRRRELSVRTALGASRAHLVRHLGAEAIVLATLGGALGVVVSRAAVGAFLALAPADVPRLAEVTVDGTALAFAVAVTFAMALFIGVIPAMKSPQAGGMRATPPLPSRDRRGWLIATEVALSVVLLVGAGLLVRSFVRLQRADTGFEAEHLVSLRLDLPASRYAGAAEVIGFHEQMLERIGALHDVMSVAGVTVLPFSGGNLSDSIAVDGVEREDIKVEFRSISGDYFPTMGMSLRAGRTVDANDNRQSAPAAVVNRSLAQAAWSGEDPLGRTITIFGNTWSVVGVVSDVRDFGLATPPAPVMYVSFNQQPRRYLTHVVRTAGDPADLIPTLRELVRAADPELPVADVATMSDRVWLSAAAPRFRTGLLGVLAAAALVLAAVGVFSVTSFAVSRRIREVGIRRALGARTGSVIGWVLGRSMRFTAAGAIAGTAVSIALAGSLRGLLFEIEPLDVPTFVTAVAVICAAALAGSLIPALRAAAIDPVAAIGDANESR